ncbi:unnamed protein product [Closterium sp. NIES-53]
MLACFVLLDWSCDLLFSPTLPTGDAMVTTTIPGGQHVSICTCTRTGRHLATFTRGPGSSLYTLATEPPKTPLWHHRLGHPSLPCLRGMHSRFLVSGLPRSLPPLPPSPALPCLPCVEGWQRTAPHSSSFPLTSAPLQTLHMDVWGLARVSGHGRERYFLLVIDEYTRYTTIFPLRSKGEGGHSPVVTLPESPQQNGISECRIGLVMEVARTSMIHAVTPHFMWLFAVRYAAHQLNLWPHISLSKTSPTLHWTRKVGDASVFRYPTSRRVLPSQDITFDESIPFYCLFPYHSAPPLPPPLFLAPGPSAVGSGAAPGAAFGGAASGGPEPGGAGSEGARSGGAEPGGAEPRGEEPGGAEPEGVEPGGAESEGAESGGAAPRGAASSAVPAGALARLSSQQLHEWLFRRAHRRSGAPGTRGAGDNGAGGAAVTTGVGGIGGTSATGPGGARPCSAGATGTGGVGCAGAGDPTEPGAAGFGGTGVGGVGSQPPLQHTSPLPAPSPYTEQSGGLTERREPASRPISPVCTARLAPRSRPPPVPGTHAMTLHPSSVPLRVPLPAPPESSLPEIPDPVSDRARDASPTVSRLLTTAVTDPSFESAAASALVAELLDFTEDFECLAAAVPRFASMLLAPEGDPDAPDIPTPRSYEEAISAPYSSQWQAAMDAEMASWKSTGTYVDEVPPPGANIVDGMWIFRVKRPPGSPPAFKARYVARGFNQRHGVDYFQNFSPTPKMNTLRGSLHEEIWLRRPPGFTGAFPAGTQWSLRRPVYGLRQAPCEWHDTLRTTLAALGFAPSTADSSLFLHTDTSLPPFYVLVYVVDLVFATADTEALTLMNTSGMGLVLGGRGLVVLTGHADASWVDDSATQPPVARLRSTLGPWLLRIYVDLGDQLRSPPVMYVDNKAMIALCQEHRLEHRTKHIALRYFLARELQQRGQLRLAYVATRANTVDVFTKALTPGDHQRFVTMSACFAFLDWSCYHLFSPTLPMGCTKRQPAEACALPVQPLASTLVITSLDVRPSPLLTMVDHLDGTETNGEHSGDAHRQPPVVNSKAVTDLDLLFSSIAEVNYKEKPPDLEPPDKIPF